jgi:uncharacterized protein (DUF488 family)
MLYTLGYQKRTQEEFFELLRAAGVAVLVDVRDVAWSHKPGFAKGSLAETARTAGLEYVHAQFAGNPKRLREQEAELGPLLDAYGMHLEANPAILDEFSALIGGYAKDGKKACIMCFERDPGECHRGVLAARWAERHKGQVVHLGDAPEEPAAPKAAAKKRSAKPPSRSTPSSP